MIEAPEIWRPVVGFEGRYEVSDLGRVRSLLSGRALAQHRTGGKGRRYWTVALYAPPPERQRRRPVHLLVLEAFVGPRPDDHLGCHNDGDTGNNRRPNLRWGTWQENEDDKHRHGTNVAGEKAWCAKLDTAAVLYIRSSNETGVALARQFGVTPQKICQVRKRQAWRHV